jgi:excinuclease ABC subunit C
MDENKADGKPRKPVSAPERQIDPRILRFRALVRQAPEEAGVYIMRDEAGEIIYVGKAKILRNRLSSYFSGRKDVKTRHLVSRIETIEWILAGSEYEALLLENNLIKEHSPKYNINLKDGKTYPSVRVTNEDFPRVFRTRRIINDGSLYFGPFPSVDTIDIYLDLIKRLFPLRRCVTMRKRVEPCMYYHIGRCAAPCAGKVTKEDYAKSVEEVTKLLSGQTEALLVELRGRMAESATALRFEEAARLRDAVSAIELFAGRANAVDFDPEARDYVAWAADGDLIVFVVFQMRGGKLTGRDLYRSRLYATEEEGLASFLMTYYDANRLPPPLVLVQEKKLRVEKEGEAFASIVEKVAEGVEGGSAGGAEGGIAAEGGAAYTTSEAGGPESAVAPAPQAPTDLGLIAEYFLKEFGAKTAFALPTERRHAVALALALQNAKEEVAKRRRELGDIPGLEDLKSALGLETLPERIEGFDIAHLHGKHTVASLVSFKNGVPDKKNYRYFKIKSLDGAVDDFASIREAVARRYTRLVNEGADLPDLILVDGGAGQVSAAKEILDALGVDSELAGLAKQDEEIYRPELAEPIRLAKDSPALRVLVAVRDETHRFATGLNQRLRASDLKFGVLEAVPGVGEARSKRLMRVFGSLDLIASADPGRVAEAGGIKLETAQAVILAAKTASRTLG